MPERPLRPCAHPGCGVLVRRGRCKQHESIPEKEYDNDRGNSYRRGYTAKWSEAREEFLRQNPLCACPACDKGRLRATPATVVDHIIPHKGDMNLFWDRGNWQPMSKPCHDRKTREDDKRYGTPARPVVNDVQSIIDALRGV